MKAKKIGVLLPCYNVRNYLSDTISSLLFQTYPNYQIYACDDLSNDHTFEELQNYVMFNRFKLYKNTKKRYWCGAYNYLAEIALNDGCDYLFIMGSDDIIENNCLSEMMKVVKDFSVVTGVMFGEKEGVIMPTAEGMTVENFRNGNAIANFTLISKEMWIELQGYDEIFRHYADWEFYLRAVKSGKLYSVVKEPLYHYRLHPGNTHKQANHEELYNLIISKHFNG